MSNFDDLVKQLGSIDSSQYKPLIDMSTIKMINPIQDSMRNQQLEMQKTFKIVDEANVEKGRLVYEREEREIESLAIQKELLDLQKLMLFFMQSINKDSKQIIENLQSLIDVVDFGFKVEEGNLALIEKELQSIKENTENVQKKFIDIVKEKMAEKGVEYAVIYMLVGFKSLILNS
ncbi:hypothetical protein [Clostridium gasigenes]|uniref:hypothetical protein n=1 Tax=Clostridium gasigenes TaxID=94869 RepID=UPI001C0D1795|nr:hypothetical protein [Clostridium gasigenes]MBU3105140.1 hypothetical protein [Clostridium gasigenes]